MPFFRRQSVGSAPELPLIARYPAPEATQGVAVDRQFFYAIANTAIGKYERGTGKKVGEFKSTVDVPLTHMDGGMTLGGKLYCSHSNFLFCDGHVKAMKPGATWTRAIDAAFQEVNPQVWNNVCTPNFENFGCGTGSKDLWNPQLQGVVYP